MAKLRINEIFQSLQGEGIDVGKRCLFIRFAGCNLNCEWCDTEWDKVLAEYDSVELLNLIEEHYSGIDYVVLTGGEPLIQDSDELESLCISLRGMGIKVGVETNGTVPPDRFGAPKLLFDLMSISPKLGSANNKVTAEYTHTAEWSNLTKVQAKFVIANSEDMSEAIQYLGNYEFNADMVVVFQPEASTGSEGFHKMLEYYDSETGGLGFGFETRFLPQVHKLLDVR